MRRSPLLPALAAPSDSKPVLEDIRALSKQVEALAAVKARPAGDAEQSSKPVVEEIKALARQIEALKSAPGRGPQIASLSGKPRLTQRPWKKSAAKSAP